MIRVALLVFILAALIVGGMHLGPWITANKGYVLISAGSMVIELTVISLILGIVLSFFTLWLVLRISRLVLAAATGSHRWLSSWQRRKANKAFKQGMLALAVGDASTAEKQLAIAKGGDFAGIDLIALGGIAAHAGQYDIAVEHYRNALAIPESKIAASVKLSEYYCTNRDVKNALQVLSELDVKAQKQPAVIGANAQALAQQGNWTLLAEKLKVWKKHISKEEYLHWEEAAAQGSYAEIASKEGANQLKTMWQGQPRKVRNDVANQVAYVRQLLSQGMHQDAEAALVQFQKKAPQPKLLPLFRELQLPNPASAMKLLEGWLKKDANDATVLSVLGCLAFHSGEMSLAEQVLQKALAIRQDKDDILLLAKVKESQQQAQAALHLYKQSLQVS